MAYTLTPDRVSTTMSLAEYVETITRTVDLRDRDSVLESAAALAALGANPDVMVDYLDQELASCRDLDLLDQNFILARGPGFAVRANLWLPPAGTAVDRESIHKLGTYQVPHDHDFSFLTVGYWGPGYMTSIYDYEPASCSGIVGSKVDIRFLETTTLSPGKIMYYRASQDIHTQEYPTGPCLSINLLLVPDRPRAQYLFDTEAGTVSGVVANQAETSVGLCTLAGHLGDGGTADRLDDLSASSVDPRVRRAAYESLLLLVPEAYDDLLRRAADDVHPLVSGLSTAEPAGLGVALDPAAAARAA
jgi:hypothetical protein